MGEGGSATPAPLVGGRYELESLLGKGGVGEVWRARHVALGSHVAIKFLHGPSADEASTRERFLTEARVAAQLKTRYAVQVFDYGITEDGRPYLVMELLDGETLRDRLRREARLSPALTVRFLLQIARALARAHSLGIVHRDLKPDNVVLVVEEESGAESIKVLDFGVAKLVRDLAPADARGNLSLESEESLAATLTRAGSLLGTPRYMAPEQILGARSLDHRADIWALGVVAFECLTGQPPFTAKGDVELFTKIQCGVHALASALVPELPASFDRWFDVACATAPESRFASAMTAALELASALGESSIFVSERGGSEPVPASTPAPAPTFRRGSELAPSPAPRPDPDAAATRIEAAEGAFYKPAWDAPLDVRACLDAIPAGATMKGLFTIPLVEEAKRRGIALSPMRERYLPFSDYPLIEHVRLLVDCAAGFWPELSMRMALRKLGRQAFPAFVKSLVGKVLWAHVDNVGAGLEAAAKAYSLTSPATRITILENTTGRARVRLAGVHYFLDSNHIGVFEGVLHACKVRGPVLVRLDTPSRGEFLLRWV